MKISDLPQTRGFARFISPEYKRKLKGQELIGRGDGEAIKSEFEPFPENDLIVEWLRENSMKEEYRHTGNTGWHYLVNGSNGTLCDVSVAEKRKSGGEIFLPKDHIYCWEVEILFQPKDRGLPSELVEVLQRLEFKAKE